MIRFTTLSGAVNLTATARSLDGIARRMARELGKNPDAATIDFKHAWAADGSYSDHRYQVRCNGRIYVGEVRVYH